jgi:hypothetical protein
MGNFGFRSIFTARILHSSDDELDFRGLQFRLVPGLKRPAIFTRAFGLLRLD